MDKILARRLVDNGKVYEQSLKLHLLSVAKLASEIGEKINLKYTSILLGLIHDIGKTPKTWQEYLISDGKSQVVTHSDVSSMYAIHLLSEKYKEYSTEQLHILLYVVSAHHGFYDNVKKDEDDLLNAAPLIKKIIGNESEELTEQIDSFFKYLITDLDCTLGCDIQSVIRNSKKEMDEFINKLKNISTNKENLYDVEYNYYIHLTVRLLLSILKEADIFDSSNVFRHEKYTVTSDNERENLWRDSSRNIEKLYEKFGKNKNTSELNKVRTRLSEEAKEKSKHIYKGILKAELPTGSGKTLLTMRYALNASETFKKDRIFYVAPFLSILDQNAREIRNLISNEELSLEHHSNIISESNYLENTNSRKYETEQYLIDSWESPVIMTTMVQFTNTIFKGRASNIRRFCKLINSTIIMDEIQSIPDKALFNFNLVNNFISEIMNTTIIHCTATQPDFDSRHLDHRIRYGKLEQDKHLSKVPASEEHVFERVKAINLNHNRQESYNTREITSIILEKYRKFGSALIICNTKSAVKKIYDGLMEHLSNSELYYLTTNMCPRHRIDTINEIKDKLDRGIKVICVSTSLVEAGVDIDFKVVFKSISSISSLIQAAGRCNREGKLKVGYFYIFKYVEEKLTSLKEIKRGADITEEILLSSDSEIVDLDSLKKRYYSKLYANASRNELSYVAKGESTTILDMLSTNRNIIRISYFRIRNKLSNLILKQAFKTATMEFSLIEDSSKTVIVYYDSGEFSSGGLIEELKEAEYDLKKYKSILKKLQPYTISVRNINDITPYLDAILNGDVYVLNKYYYDEKIGLKTEKLETLIL